MTKNLLALNFSGRKTGNCSIVLQEIIRPCKDQDLNIDQVNVALLKIRSCVGCFGCNNGELRCTMNDDLETIKEKIAWADAILIVTPSYTFSAPGIMKNIMDRSAAWAFVKIEEDQKSRIGISISIGGAPEQWNALQRVFPGLFLKLFNCEVLHQSVYRGIGLKGEVLLNPAILNQMHVVGAGLVKALNGEKNSFPENPEDQSRLVCPLCKADVFQVRQDGDYICATCGTEIKRSGLLKKHLLAGKSLMVWRRPMRSTIAPGSILNKISSPRQNMFPRK
jgi:multimeric flavodoxin WrbA